MNKKEELLAAIEADVQDIVHAEANLAFDVQLAHKNGASWSEIADALGMTADEAQAKYS